MEYYSEKYKNKVRPGHKEPNNRAAVKVSVACVIAAGFISL